MPSRSSGRRTAGERPRPSAVPSSVVHALPPVVLLRERAVAIRVHVVVVLGPGVGSADRLAGLARIGPAPGAAHQPPGLRAPPGEIRTGLIRHRPPRARWPPHS